MYDSRPDTLEHIDRVRYFMNNVMYNLRIRHNNHDASKLTHPELSAFDIATPKLADLGHAHLITPEGVTRVEQPKKEE
jgi:hypothetical protein